MFISGVCHPYLVDMGCRGPTTCFKRGQSWYHPTPLGFQPVRMYIYICICIHTHNICIQWNMYIKHLSINLSVCLPIYLPYLSVCLPIYLTIYLSDCLSTYESIYLNFINTCLSSCHFLKRKPVQLKPSTFSEQVLQVLLFSSEQKTRFLHEVNHLFLWAIYTMAM